MRPSPNSPTLGQSAIRLRWMIAAGASFVLLVSWLYAPWSETGPVLCPLRLFTGIPCPSCGLTRSFCATAHGDLGAAFGFHLLGPPLFLATVLLIALCVLESVRGTRVESAHRFLFSSRVAWFEAGVLVAYHVWRLGTQLADGELAHSVQRSVLALVWRQIAPAG